MTSLIDSPCGRRGARLLMLVAIAAGCFINCSTPGDQSEETADQIIGTPPTAEEDPFFMAASPGQAEAAAPRGRIGEDGPESASDGQSASATEPRVAGDDDKPRCFSCVRICPVEGGCESAKEDVICGWGVHDDPDEAGQLARAECDAALDLARQMPVWSRIDGGCPAATCR